jgi:hypothetical protein
MLQEQRWGLAILVSQELARALPKPTWRVVFGEDQWRSSNILEPVLGQPFEKESKTIDAKNLVEPLEPRLHVSIKWKRCTCGSGGVSITT